MVTFFNQINKYCFYIIFFLEYSAHDKNLLNEKSNLKSNRPNAAANLVKTTTPLYYVIKDPRESRRQRLLELRRQLNSDKEPLTTTTTEIPEPKIDFTSEFELPTVRDKLATFSLTNGAKINHYKWIGIYNQCLKVLKIKCIKILIKVFIL